MLKSLHSDRILIGKVQGSALPWTVSDGCLVLPQEGTEATLVVSQLGLLTFLFLFIS